MNPSGPADAAADGPQPSEAMRAVLQRLAELRGDAGDRYAMPFEAARRQLLAERRWWLEEAPAIRTDERTIEVDDGAGGRRALRLRDYLPGGAGEAPARIVYLHGGGWCVGSIDTHDGILRRLALASGLPVTGLDYSLAPEHPHPAAARDVRAVLAALRAGAPGGTRWVLGGDSAGAHLALLEALRARDAGEVPVDALLLWYGVYRPVGKGASMRAFGDGRFGLSRAALERYQHAFLGGRPPSEVPDAFPLARALHDLPPCWVGAAALDPLLDDSIRLVDALRAAGAHPEWRRFDGVAHGFLSYARLLPDASEAIGAAAAFARRTAAHRVSGR